jgi:uncharacterized protein YjbJ (UPF0337 family)
MRFVVPSEESAMSKLREKTQGLTKQVVGQMVGDEALVREGKEQEQNADRQGETQHNDAGRGSDRPE